MLPQAKMQIGMIKAVNNKKHKEIPSNPNDKFKLYSEIKGNWHANWNPTSDLSKWYHKSIHKRRKITETMSDKERTPSSSSWGIKQITAIQKLKYSIKNINTGMLGIVWKLREKTI